MRSTYIKSLLAAVVMLTMVTSCADNGEEATPEPLALTFYLQTADARTVTRATEGEVDETSGEGTLYTVKAWLFSENEPGVLLDYKEVSSATQMTMSLPQYIVSKREPVALYVLANAESVGLEGLNAATTRDELKQAVMGGSYFQTNPTATVPSEGLPYSCVKRNWVVADEAGENVLPSTQLGTILLTRAVSKIRFAFARTKGLDDVEVTGLQLDAALLPTSQYVFPIDSVDNAANYATVNNIKFRGDRYPNIKSADGYIGSLTSIYPSGATNAHEGTLVSNANIREYADPTLNTWESYVAANPSTYNARDYNDLISQVQQGKYDLTYYFRETDNPLTGVIYYKIGGQNKSTKFSMPAENAGDFTRNHIWIVYGYFQGEELVLKVVAQPWYWWYGKSNYTENVTMTDQLQWNSETYASKTEQDFTVEDNTQTFDVVVLKPNTMLEGTLTFDTPYHGTWMAMLESINGSTEGSIVFADGSVVAMGTIGNPITLNIKAGSTEVTINQYARLRFVCYSEEGQAYSVQSGTLGGNYVIARYAN